MSHDITSRKSTKSDQHSLIIDLDNCVFHDLVGECSYKNAPRYSRELHSYFNQE